MRGKASSLSIFDSFQVQIMGVSKKLDSLSGGICLMNTILPVVEISTLLPGRKEITSSLVKVSFDIIRDSDFIK